MLLPAASYDWLELLDEPAALIGHGADIITTANARFAATLGRGLDAVNGLALAQLVDGGDAARLATATATTDAADIVLGCHAGALAMSLTWRFGAVRSGQRLLRLAPAQPADVAPAAMPRAEQPEGMVPEREVQELRQKLAWFREAIDKVHHSVVVFDRQDRLVLYNRFYRDGYRSGDRVLPPEVQLEGKTYRELMELRVRYKLHKEFADEPEKFIEDRVRRFEAGSDHITYLATGAVVRSQYRRLADGIRVYISTDITELVETEQRQRATELAYRTKSQFLANMSHELRTPLNAVIGFSELIRDATAGPLDARYRSHADDIHAAGQHLLNLINDILDLSKIEVGRMVLRDGTVDIASLVAKCCRLVQECARDGRVVLEQDVPSDIPCLLADELRLKQVMLNLLSNAVRFTPPGGHVRVAASCLPDGRLALSVADSGVGMSREDIEQALIPFQQIDRNMGRGRDGTGLGLPLAKTLTELHGARFEIDSALEVGTTVTIMMPVERVLNGYRRQVRLV